MFASKETGAFWRDDLLVDFRATFVANVTRTFLLKQVGLPVDRKRMGHMQWYIVNMDTNRWGTRFRFIIFFLFFDKLKILIVHQLRDIKLSIYIGGEIDNNAGSYTGNC